MSEPEVKVREKGEDALITQDPEPLLDYLVRLAMEALDRTMAQSTPTHRGFFETHARERMAQAAQMITNERATLRSERDAAEAALVKINKIRNSIIGAQAVNWSEHVYPLVAALEEAGVAGMPYPEARENMGTLLTRVETAEAALAEVRERAVAFEGAVVAMLYGIDDGGQVETARRRLVAALAAIPADLAAERDRRVQGEAYESDAECLEAQARQARDEAARPEPAEGTAWSVRAARLESEAARLRARAADLRGGR